MSTPSIVDRLIRRLRRRTPPPGRCTVDRLIGPERTARVIQPLVRELMRDDLLPEPVAYRIVCEGVLAGDPWWLAEPGQVWQLRPDAAEPAAPGLALLVIVQRDTDQLTVQLEDDDAPHLQIPLCALAAYELTSWCWLREDHGPLPTS
ncbi:hypothetical protein J8N05_47150 (plasmid) [Streptomyces sp. BH-SS-21]|uniref:Uncharacterized protein n=1 Tax=Streptomyces liliiviolaceus TaxID=2823109 RepID=A0A940Y5T8_9ACTN|nr:hypothetical protein [Streptomyces liliiviolaceus]MBQ0855740.1 hypothetical protein [Streptomyces liliiviolaceus]